MAGVISRLFRPMEVAGREVVPRLVHGDLLEENTGTDPGLPKIFDSCSLYAHNECEPTAPQGPLVPT
jgi:protein-ribulosamine 3-kinase